MTCRGIELPDGNWSGCAASGTGATDCPACGVDDLAAVAPAIEEAREAEVIDLDDHRTTKALERAAREGGPPDAVYFERGPTLHYPGPPDAEPGATCVVTAIDRDAPLTTVTSLRDYADARAAEHEKATADWHALWRQTGEQLEALYRERFGVARWEPEFPCGFYVAAKGRWTILARAVRHNLTAPKETT